jgi:ribonuclease P protein component
LILTYESDVKSGNFIFLLMSLKIFRIKKSTEFHKIGQNGQKFYSKTVLLISHSSPQSCFQNLSQNKRVENFCRVGFTVSKAIGNSVTRNRSKRRLREAFRSLAGLAKNHQDYVLIARKEIIKSDFAKITGDLKFCLKRIHQISFCPKSASKDPLFAGRFKK